MEKFNKQQRHELYKEFLADAEIALANGRLPVRTWRGVTVMLHPFGLCHLVHWHLGWRGLADGEDFKNVMYWFDELLEHKPENATDQSYWWFAGDWSVRVEALKQAIEATA